VRLLAGRRVRTPGPRGFAFVLARLEWRHHQAIAASVASARRRRRVSGGRQSIAWAEQRPWSVPAAWPRAVASGVTPAPPGATAREAAPAGSSSRRVH
jgi:hypothetical protein